MTITSEEVIRRFPIHWLVWNNQHEELKNALEARKYTSQETEAPDPRGRTPLLLAVILGRTEAARALLDGGADVNCENEGWTAVQEAAATGDAEMLSLVLSRRSYARRVARSFGVPELLRRLSLAPDFYVEMKWEFTSWVPLVSRMCPFDTYKVYKRGGNVRVDTTLVGFENNRWVRGDRTFMFQGEGQYASFTELDHEHGTMWREYLRPTKRREPVPPRRRAVKHRLAAPLAVNYLDTDKICFERNKSGVWGWRQDKTETVNGYECKVYGANNVEVVSKTRSAHLPRARRAAPRAPLAGLLALAEPEPEQEPEPEPEPERDPEREPLAPREDPEEPSPSGACQEEVLPVTWEEYFSDRPLERDIGRPRDEDIKVQKFKATLWLCEDYPLQLQEQIIPILDLMAAIQSPHFTKLKDFVQMQLPSGFPVKIEIPLFHVLNARITFGNIFATEAPVTHIECISEGDRLSCVVDDMCFALGDGYSDGAASDDRLSGAADGEEGLLQYAIQQSLIEAGTLEDQVDVWEALRGAAPAAPRELLTREETQLQRAIEESLAAMALPAETEPLPKSEPESDAERDLREALALSARDQARLEHQLAEEQRALDEALRLSLLDK